MLIAVFANFTETTVAFVTSWGWNPSLTTTAYHIGAVSKTIWEATHENLHSQVTEGHLEDTLVTLLSINLFFFFFNLFSLSSIHQGLPGNASGVFIRNLVSSIHESFDFIVGEHQVSVCFVFFTCGCSVDFCKSMWLLPNFGPLWHLFLFQSHWSKPQRPCVHHPGAGPASERRHYGRIIKKGRVSAIRSGCSNDNFYMSFCRLNAITRVT